MSKIDYGRLAGRAVKGASWYSRTYDWQECWRCHELKELTEFRNFGARKSHWCAKCEDEWRVLNPGKHLTELETRRRVEVDGLDGTRKGDASPTAKATLDRLMAAYEAGTLDPELASATSCDTEV